MTLSLKIYGLSLLIFLLIDGLWLGVIARNLYQTQIGHLLSDSPKLWAAALFYLLFLVGLLVFVIMPAINGSLPLPSAAARAALFGLVTYATYDLTNLATLKDWPLLVTGIDLLWGALLSTAVSLATLYLARFFNWL